MPEADKPHFSGMLRAVAEVSRTRVLMRSVLSRWSTCRRRRSIDKDELHGVYRLAACIEILKCRFSSNSLPTTRFHPQRRPLPNGIANQLRQIQARIALIHDFLQARIARIHDSRAAAFLIHPIGIHGWH